ncbi:MAG TPA: putative Ig domain-containing protein, partial [Prosthecobacter sp.]|nr:putative Ig domain-containing protein [Prosthecobacter sp.]
MSATLSISPSTLPGAAQYTPYSQSLAASGGTAPYAWSVSPALPAGAVSWWLAENGPGDALAANHGIMHNGVTYTTGAIGSAFNFDGVDDRVEAADSASLRPSVMTLEAWVKPAASGVPVNGVVAAKTTGTAGTDGYGFGQLGSSDAFGFWINDRATNRVTATLAPDVWSHVVATYDGSTMKLYVNGGLISSRSYSGAIVHSSSPLVIGNNGGGAYAWSGGVDEVMLYNRAISAAEVVARHQYTVAANNGLPDGLVLNPATGVLSGTPTSFPGTYNFYARASDVNGSPGVRGYSLNVACPTVSIAPASLPAATQHAAYGAQTLAASGGTGPYLWSIFSGSLPTGMSLSSTGVLSGTPGSAAGTYNFTIQARDANNCAATRDYTLTVQCPAITLSSTTFANAAQFAAYSPVTLSASGGNEPYAFTIHSGALPLGMSLSAAGVVSGTPSAIPATYNFTVRATDAANCTGTRAYSITVTCAAISITPTTLPAAAKYSAYSQSLTASNGNGSYVWELASGSLPAGISLSSTGVISGTSTAAPGAYNFSAKVTDAQGCTATRSYTLSLNCPAATILPASLPDVGILGGYSQTLTVTGGAPAYTWDVQSGSLPLGITLTSAGVLTGTTTLPGNYSFVARATAADSCVVTRSYTLSVATNCPTITISPTNLPGGQTSVAYSQTLTANGGVGPYTWVRTSGALPAGLTLSSAGVISGTPTAGPGTYNFTVQATDSNTCTGSQSFTLTLSCATLSITPATLTGGTVGSAYSAGLSTTGGTAPFTYSIASGSLPAGLSLSGVGLISGTPTVATTATFTVESRDAFNCTTTREYTLTTACPAMTVTPENLPAAYKNIAYSQSLSVSAGTGPFAWATVSGAPPAGITLSAAGVLSGTPASFGSGTFTVRVTDTYGCTTTRQYTLVVKGITLGDLVYEDANFNGLKDGGEAGVSGASVQLWDPGADNAIGGSGPNADVQVGAAVTTTASGAYAFQNLVPGYYYVRVVPPAGLPISGGNPVNADNGINNDNNGVSQPGGPGTAIYGPVVNLTSGGEPTGEDGDADTDLTLDFGLFRGMNVGNLVWEDADDDGLKDAGEAGLSGVSLELWAAGADNAIGGTDDVRLRTTTSS